MCILFAFSALVEEPTKMVIVEQRASADAAASMHSSFSASSGHMETAMQAMQASSSQYSFESMSASSMSAMMAESLVSISSSSQMMEMSAHSHVEASSSSSSSSMRALTTGVKRGEIHFTSCLSQWVTCSCSFTGGLS